MFTKNVRNIGVILSFMGIFSCSELVFAQDSLSNKFSNIFSSRPGSKAVVNEEGKKLKDFSKPNKCVRHYTWGAPKIKDTAITSRSLYVCRELFAVQYDPKLKVPLWASEQLTKYNLELESFENNIKLQPDLDLPTSIQQKPEDYLKTNYLPAPLASVRNMVINLDNTDADELRKVNLEAISQAKKFSNTVPMINNNLANTIWRELESQTISFAKKASKLYVTTGVIYLNGESNGKLAYSQTYIPTHFFKIMIDPDTHGSISYIIPNKEILTENTKSISDQNNVYKCAGGPCSLSNFIVHIKEVEKVTGMEFFPELNPNWAVQIKLNIGELYKEQNKKAERIKELQKMNKQ